MTNELIREYAKKRKESVWAQFLNLLNRPDTFIQNMAARYGPQQCIRF